MTCDFTGKTDPKLVNATDNTLNFPAYQTCQMHPIRKIELVQMY